MPASERETDGPSIIPDAWSRAAGTISRGALVKALLGGVVGGVASRAAVAPHPATARRRRELKPLFAVVAADAQLIRGKGIAGVIRGESGQPGEYEALFLRDVNTCAYAASTINGVAGQVSVTGHDQPAHFVSVKTTNSSGTAQDIGFSLLVLC